MYQLKPEDNLSHPHKCSIGPNVRILGASPSRDGYVAHVDSEHRDPSPRNLELDSLIQRLLTT